MPPVNSITGSAAALWLGVLAAVAGGCGGGQKGAGPARPINCLACPADLLRISRVVFVEVHQDVGYPGIAAEATEALFQALQKRRLFHVDVVARTDPACRELCLGGARTYSIQELAGMRQALGCDAVLLGDINHFQPHPRMQISLCLRLIDLRRGKVVWAIDHVWDTTDKATECRIKRYFERQMRSGYDPADWQLALMSPKTFLKFVSYEACDTLPSRTELADAAEDLELDETSADNVLDATAASVRKLKKSLSRQ